MTIGTTISEVTLQGNGATSAFDYPFLIPAAFDAVVIVTTAAGVQTVLQTSQYTIAGIGNPAGGSVTYPLSGPPLPAGAVITIQRVLPLIQAVSLSNQGPTFQAIEGALDYLTMALQQVQAQIGNALTGNVGDPPGLVYSAPPVPVRAGQAMGWDAFGNVTVNAFATAPISAGMQPVVAAASPAIALEMMGGITGGVFDYGTVNAIEITLPAIPPSEAYLIGVPICIIPLYTNTGATTIQEVFLGPQQVKRRDGSDCIGGEFVAGAPTWVAWTGLHYVLFGIAPASDATTVAVADAQSAVTPAGLGVALTEFFPFLAAANGTFTLANGIVVQWGTAVSGAGGVAPVTWPKPFPNNVFAVVASLYGDGIGAYTILVGSPSETGTTFQANLAAVGTSGLGFFWIAVGN